jgi:hypothetical protein
MVDEAELTLRSERLYQCGIVRLSCIEAGNELDLRNIDFAQLCSQRLCMVDYIMCAKIQTPLASFRARRSGNNREPCKPTCLLDQDRTETARCADNQQVARIGRLAWMNVEAIKQ